MNSNFTGFKNGTSGWTKFNTTAGTLVIQWGYIDGKPGNPWYTTVTLPVPYSDNNYLILRTAKNRGNSSYYPSQGNGYNGNVEKTNSNFQIAIGTDGGVSGANWMTMGFI